MARESLSRDQTWSRSPVGQTFLSAMACLVVSTASADNSSFADRLSSLAARCDELGLKDQATITRAWMIDRHPGRHYLFLPLVTDPAAPKSGAPETVNQWHNRFLDLRRDHAAELFAQAKAASDHRQPAHAYQLLFE